MAVDLGTLKLSMQIDSRPLQILIEQLKQAEALSQSTGRAIGGNLSQGMAQGLSSGAMKTALQGTFTQLQGNATTSGKAIGRNLTIGVTEGMAGSISAIVNIFNSSRGALQSGISQVFQGVFQGVGQQIYATLQNTISGALRSVGDMTSVIKFDAAQAKIATLTNDVAGATKVARDLSKELGYTISSTEALDASYDVLSSGFSSAADSANVLKAAQKGAVGGFSDLNTVANATTSILNAYGLSSEHAADVVDQMAGTQNAGKITINEYAGMIGQVATTAAQAGVRLDELNSYIATATVKGVPASSAIAGLRQAISSILKPSDDAKKLAEMLGVAFDANALKAKGLSGVMGELRAKNADSAQTLTRLFGSVEATAALLPSAGKGAADFAKNLETVKNTKADDAFNKVANSIEFLQKKNAVLRQELDLKFKTAIAPMFEAGNIALGGLLQNMQEGGLTFEALHTASQQFTDTLKQNPEIFKALTDTVTILLQQGLNQLTIQAQKLTQYLKENPGAVQQFAGAVQQAAVSMAAAAQFAIQFGSGFVEGLSGVIQILGPLGGIVQSLVGAATGSDSLARSLGQVAAYIAVIGVGLQAFGIIAGVVGPILSIVSALGSAVVATAAWVSAVGGLGAILASVGTVIGGIAVAIGPIVLIVAAIAGAIAAIVVIVQNWESITKAVGDAMQGVGRWVRDAYDKSGIFKQVWEAITRIIMDMPLVKVTLFLVDAIAKSDLFKAAWNGIGAVFQSVGGWIKKWVIDPIMAAKDALAGLIGMGQSNDGGSGGGTLSAADASTASSVKLTAAIAKQSGISNPFAQAALAGTIQQESNFDPNAKEGGGTGNGRGLVQWDVRDRAKGVVKMDASGTPVGNQYHEQLSKGIDEMVADYKAATGRNLKEDLNAAKNVREAMAVFQKTIRFGESGSRDQFANQALSVIQSGAGNINQSGGGGATGVKKLPGSISGNLDASGQNGADMDVGPNGEMKSYHNGVVSELGTAGNNGNYVTIDYIDDLGNKLEATYSHIAAAVKKGDQVVGGQVLGKFDGSGRTFGAHNSIDINSPGTNGALQRSQETAAARRGADLLVKGVVQGTGGGGVGGSGGASPAPNQLALTGKDGKTSYANKVGGAVGGDTKDAGVELDTSLMATIEEARRGEDTRLKKQREEAKSLQRETREKDKLALQKLMAQTANPDIKKTLQEQLSIADATGGQDDKLLESKQQREDLVKARERKVKDLASTNPDTIKKAQQLPDYSSSIVQLDKVIKLQQQNREQAIANLGITKQTDDIQKDLANSRAQRDQAAKTAYQNEAQALDLKIEKARAEGSLQVPLLELQKQRLEATYQSADAIQKEQDKLDELNKARDAYLKSGVKPDVETVKQMDAQIKLLTGNIQALKSESATKVAIIDQKDVLAAKQLAISLKEIALNKAAVTGERDVKLMQGLASAKRRKGDEFGANAIDLEASKKSEEMRYQRELFDNQRQVKSEVESGATKLDEMPERLKELNDQSRQLNAINLDSAKDQFKTLGQTVGETVKGAFKSFFTDVLTGTKTMAEAFKGLIDNLLSKLAELAVNSIFGSLFGGGGGGGIGSLFGGGGGGGGGGLLSGLFGGFARDGGMLTSGGLIPNFAGGGLVDSIQSAMGKEGEGARLIVAKTGERILTRDQAKLFDQYKMLELLKPGGIPRFSDGGMVGGSPSLAAPQLSKAAGGGSTVTVNVPISVDSGSGIDAAALSKKLVPQFRNLVIQVMGEQQRPGGAIGSPR
jgi:TP901 family phage tail tape measure protein